MLRSASHLIGYNLDAADGEIGRVHDFLFDDVTWTTRYMVADTRRWLPGRRVLLAPQSLAAPDWRRNELPITLTKEQIQEAPSLDEDKPVSRQHEKALHEYYGWVPYWGGPGPAFSPPMDTNQAAATAQSVETQTELAKGDPHLRSINEVKGYHIAATDGEVGHVDDMILDDEDWTLRYLVVDTKNWLPGTKVLVAPQWIRAIDWEDRKVAVDLPREQIEKSPEFNPFEPVNRQYEERLYDFYGRPVYW